MVEPGQVENAMHHQPFKFFILCHLKIVGVFCQCLKADDNIAGKIAFINIFPCLLCLLWFIFIRSVVQPERELVCRLVLPPLLGV
jgi:hypothetical protein